MKDPFMYPHRIRLRGPWLCEPLQRRGDNSEQPLPPSFRLTMPCRWSEGGLPGFTGRVRLRRDFGYPGRLDAYERVWLTFAGVGGAAEACLNDRPLGRIVTASEFEVTRWLRQRNELVVDVDGAAEEGGLWGEVALEVRCTAFLCDLRRSAILTAEGVEWRVAGRVVGEAERPLEVYVLLDRSVVGYQVVTATAEGQPFELLGSAAWKPTPESGQAVPMQVDLVNGAVVWYSSGGDVMLETGSEQDR
jgi:hypothetical protein